jgi:ribose transport system permease protein
VTREKTGEHNDNSWINLALFVAVMLAASVIFHFMTGRMFLESGNLRVIVSNSIYPTFIAWGMCFLFACGYTDLSIGGVVVLGSFASCALGNAWGYPGVIIGGLVAGTLLVFINFGLFAFTRIPSWIASISLAMIYEALAVFLRANRITKAYFNVELSRSYRALGKLPANAIILIVGFVIVYLVYNRTNVCLNIRAIGGNKDVSRALGVNLLKTLLWVGLICGMLIGVSCVIQQSYNVKTVPMAGLTSIQLIFKPLAIALLAQILQKSINIVVSVPFCSLAIYGVFNVMTFFGIPSGTLQDVLLCLFLILFGIGGQRGVEGVVK